MKKILFLLLICLLCSCNPLEGNYRVYFDDNPDINNLSKIYDGEIEIGNVKSISKTKEKYAAKIKIKTEYIEKITPDKCFYVNNNNLYMAKFESNHEKNEKLNYNSEIIGFNSAFEYTAAVLKNKTEKLKKVFE